VKLLLTKDINPDTKDNYNSTPLSFAARSGHMEVTSLLLAIDSVDPDSKDNFGRTPLFWAARKGNPNVIKLLLEKCHKDGISICGNGLNVATSPTTSTESRFSCDVCLLSIPNADPHYHCETCCNGDFDICQECMDSRAHCLDHSHKLGKRVIKDNRVAYVPD
jgi:hypothetical protein